MTAPTWIDVPGNVAHDEPIDFEIAVAPVCITLEFLTDPDPELNQGDWAVVWDDGRFSWRFRDSENVGNQWTIRPPGGSWNGIPFRVHVNPTFTGYGGGGIAPNLSPILEPEAWYVLDPINRLVDQSGNAHSLSEIVACTDVAGPSLGYVATHSGKFRTTPHAAFRTGGAVSFAALVHRANYASGGTWIAGCEDVLASWGTWWKFGIESDGRLMCACDRGGPSPLEVFAYLSGVNAAPANDWAVVAGTRSADGLTWRGYVEGVQTGTHTQSSPGFGSAGGYLFVTQDGWLTPTIVRHQVVGVWDRELSPAEIADVSLALRGVLP